MDPNTPPGSCGLQRDAARLLTLQAAPPVIMDLTKMPRSAWLSLALLPLTLTPNPADPESLRGISNVINSRVPSGVKIKSSCSF